MPYYNLVSSDPLILFILLLDGIYSAEVSLAFSAIIAFNLTLCCEGINRGVQSISSCYSNVGLQSHDYNIKNAFNYVTCKRGDENRLDFFQS